MRDNAYYRIIRWFNLLDYERWINIRRKFNKYERGILYSLERHGYSHNVGDSYIYKIKNLKYNVSHDNLMKPVCHIEDTYERRRDYFEKIEKNDDLLGSLSSFDLVILYIHKNNTFIEDELMEFVVSNSNCSRRIVKSYLSRLVLTNVVSKNIDLYEVNIIPEFALRSTSLISQPNVKGLPKDSKTYNWSVEFNSRERVSINNIGIYDYQIRLQSMGYAIIIGKCIIKVKDIDTDLAFWGYNSRILSMNERLDVYIKECMKGLPFQLIKEMTPMQYIYYTISTENELNTIKENDIINKYFSKNSITRALNSLVLRKKLNRSGNTYTLYKHKPNHNRDIYEIANRIKQLKEKKNGKN